MGVVRARSLVAAAVTVVAIVAVSGLAGSLARAEPRVEASGFVGVDWFGARSQLGNSWAPEQVPGTSPVVGGRIGWLALPDLLSGEPRLALAIEGELAVAPAYTGDSVDHRRMRYFAPVFEWRSQAMLQLVLWRGIAPHLMLGGGGDTVAPSSPFMARDTEPIAYWGLGLSAPLTGSWQLRFDLHHGVMPARNGGLTSTMELELGIGMSFGSTPAGRREPPAPAPAPAPGAREPDRDRDGDGDARDACPDRPGPPGSAAGARCPEPDPDGDGITGPADRCPDQPEDRDGFEDDDGCPDPDNDGDGLPDAQDACPDAAETANGWQDEDGCPDQLPDDVAGALATNVRFAPGHARVPAAARPALDAMRDMLERRPELRIEIVGHPERAGGEALARRRTEAVKWYLVDQGIPEDRIITHVGAVPSALAVVFQLVPPRR
jgi:OOP family OmpA-OmpF porin